jgi:hypothetical protein
LGPKWDSPIFSRSHDSKEGTGTGIGGTLCSLQSLALAFNLTVQEFEAAAAATKLRPISGALTHGYANAYGAVDAGRGTRVRGDVRAGVRAGGDGGGGGKGRGKREDTCAESREAAQALIFA